MTAFFCHLDCSGSSTDKIRQKAISVGGYVSTQKAWAEFEVLWQYILYRYGIREFHMSDYAKRWVDRKNKVHYLYPFQACDFIAYEQAKAVTNTLRGNNQPRKSLRRANLRDPTMWQIIREPKLEAFVKNFGIPRRT